MQKIRVLFLIHDLGGGGAEKVLVNLVNHMNHERFEVSLIALFGGGVNERNLVPQVHYSTVFPRPIPGNSRLMKLLSPATLHKLMVSGHYDVEVAYTEGVAARVVSGCDAANTRLYCWIHSTTRDRREAGIGFRSYAEACQCYERFDSIVAVSGGVREAFRAIFPSLKRFETKYNTIEADRIRQLSLEPVPEGTFGTLVDCEVNLVAVGKICKAKGFDRLARITKRLREDGLLVHMYALGTGPDERDIAAWLKSNKMESHFTFLGYQANPYKYVARCDLFVCASLAEGFSTATTEALVMGIPVCTVEVSGMRELLGENNEWGVVTKNDEDALYEAIGMLVRNPDMLAHYREMSRERGKAFSTAETVMKVEELLEGQVYGE